MESVLIAAIALGLLAIRGIAAFAIVYVGARLAIRHERGV
jgi:hypothetical protein